jgi:hypothetical protein
MDAGGWAIQMIQTIHRHLTHLHGQIPDGFRSPMKDHLLRLAEREGEGREGKQTQHLLPRTESAPASRLQGSKIAGAFALLLRGYISQCFLSLLSTFTPVFFQL